MNDAPLPLTGIRVLDFTQNLPGPYATLLLASLGAEVIKVEPPGGEPGRTLPRLFAHLNRGKRCITVDLNDPVDRERIRSLLPTVDVLVEGFRPGVMRRFGLDAGTLRRSRPEMIYCAISGYGQTGPWADRPGHDVNYQAVTGACHMHRDAAQRPTSTVLPVGDFSAALNAACGILAALVGRGRTGEGAMLDVAITDALAAWTRVWHEGLSEEQVDLVQAVATLQRRVGRRAASRRTEASPRVLPQRLAQAALSRLTPARLAGLRRRLLRLPAVRRYRRRRLYILPAFDLFRTRDGRWLSLGILNEDKFWRAFCEQAGLRILTGLTFPARILLSGLLQPVVRARIRCRTLAEWTATLDPRRVPFAPVLNADEAAVHPQLRRRPMNAGGKPGDRTRRAAPPPAGSASRRSTRHSSVDPLV